MANVFKHETRDSPGADHHRSGGSLPVMPAPGFREVLGLARVSLEVLAIAGVYFFLVVAARDCRLPRTGKIRQREARAAIMLAERDEEIQRVREG